MINMVTNQKISTVFQPIINLRSDCVYGYEVLSRVDGIGIEALIRYARQNGYMQELDTAMCNGIIQQIGELPEGKKLFINVETVAGCHILLAAIRRREIARKSIIVEITERADFTENFEKALSAVRALNVPISIDDFGTGTANFEQLLHLRPEYVKLDRAFLLDIDKDRSLQLILKSLYSLSDEMNFKLITEGVENSDQLKMIRSVGIRYAQGFLLGRPK